MHRHPNSGEQLWFKRREYRANPIEPPEEHHPADFLIVITAVVGLITAIIIAILERINT